MATYIVLNNFTDQGIRSVKDSPKRAEAFRALAKKAGVTVKEIYWTLGRHDLVAILEAADAATIASLTLASGALGNVRSETLTAFSAEQFGAIVGRMP